MPGSRCFEDILIGKDYDPFGMQLIGRTWALTSEEYRFGFNGQEQDKDIYGKAIVNSAEYWEYDSRLGRRWNKDQIVFASTSSYVVLNNCPILFNDPNGNWPIIGTMISQITETNTTFSNSNNPTVQTNEDITATYIIVFRCFIPHEYVNDPNPRSKSKKYKGDNRFNYDYNSSRYRTEQRVEADFETRAFKVTNNRASGSTGVNKDNEVVKTSEPGIAGTVYHQPSFADPTINYLSVQFYVKAINKAAEDEAGLLGGAVPAINADIWITIVPKADGTFEYKIYGSLDGFPAFELFVYDVDNKRTYLVLNRTPTETGEYLGSLFGNGEGEHDYNYTGKSSTTEEGGFFWFKNKKNTKEVVSD